jgi:hypothetical protein
VRCGNVPAGALHAGGMSCDQMAGCGVRRYVQVFEAVKNDQCFGTGRQAAVHKVHLITSLIAARQGQQGVVRGCAAEAAGGLLCMQTMETVRRNEAVLQIPGAGSKTRKTWGARGDWRVVGPGSLCSSHWPARAPIVTCDASRWHSRRVGESGPGRSARWRVASSQAHRRKR